MNTTKEIVQMTVAELRRNNMIRISQTNVFQKTEKILYMYQDIHDVDDPFLISLEKALNKIKDDPDFEIIDLKYFQKMTHEEMVAMPVLEKICAELDCNIGDIVEFTELDKVKARIGK